MSNHITLLDLNLKIRDTLQDAFPETVWIVAEISELKENRTGHCYLELIEKDASSDEIIARARATVWSYTWRMLRPYFETTTGQRLAQGIKVLVQVSVEFHAAYGISLNIRDIDPTYTIGDLARRRREIISRLTKAGVMEMNRELPLPLVPQRVAVISSATAAGYGDFVDHLENNSYGFRFHHVLFEAFMQGSEAAPDIIQALHRIFAREDSFDVVVIIRGGGAAADLSCFDNYDLAYTLAQMPLPVITGIGHEKDDTIADMVAHTRLKTPTAVAEFLITGTLRFRDRLIQLEEEISEAVRLIITDQQLQISGLAKEIAEASDSYVRRSLSGIQKSGHRLQQGVTVFTFTAREKVMHIENLVSRTAANFIRQHETQLRSNMFRFRISPVNPLERANARLRDLLTSLPGKISGQMRAMEADLHRNEEKLRLLDPLNILKRGFTITSQNGRIIQSAKDVSEETEISTRFHDGAVTSKFIKRK